MTFLTTLQRVEAVVCPACNGHGSTLGVFHRFPCDACYQAGYVQLANHQPLDTIAASIIANAWLADREAARQASFNDPNSGTPDNWVLKNNFRGD